MMDKAYIEIVRLLLESAPAIFETPQFAMKGGTAINLFIEDMIRLSVDIDVVFTNHEASRDQALKSISAGLDSVRKLTCPPPKTATNSNCSSDAGAIK